MIEKSRDLSPEEVAKKALISRNESSCNATVDLCGNGQMPPMRQFDPKDPKDKEDNPRALMTAVAIAAAEIVAATTLMVAEYAGVGVTVNIVGPVIPIVVGAVVVGYLFDVEIPGVKHPVRLQREQSTKSMTKEQYDEYVQAKEKYDELVRHQDLLWVSKNMNECVYQNGHYATGPCKDPVIDGPEVDPSLMYYYGNGQRLLDISSSVYGSSDRYAVQDGKVIKFTRNESGCYNAAVVDDLTELSRNDKVTLRDNWNFEVKQTLKEPKEQLKEQEQINKGEAKRLKVVREELSDEISRHANSDATLARIANAANVLANLDAQKAFLTEQQDAMIDGTVTIVASWLYGRHIHQKADEKRQRNARELQQTLLEESRKTPQQKEEEARRWAQRALDSQQEALRLQEALQKLQEDEKNLNESQQRVTDAKKQLKKAKSNKPRENDANRNGNSGPDKDPEKDPKGEGSGAAVAAGAAANEVNKKMQYEGNPGKHHPNSPPNIGKPPVNGQRTLENSIEVPGKDYRVGIEGDKIIQFNQHAPNKYHGYIVENFFELDREAQKILVKEGLVRSMKSGKVVK